jgi:hypothetical protein
MFTALAEPLVRLAALPAFASLVLAALIGWIGRDGRSGRLAGAAPAIAFSWIAAHEIGVALFPPVADDNGLFYVIAGALALGIAFDLWLGDEKRALRPLEAGFALAGGLAAVSWLRDTLVAWTVLLVAGWMVVVLRTRFVARTDPATASLLVALGGAGLALTAWASGLNGEHDLALAFACAAAGYFILNWIAPSLPFGTTALFAGGALLLILAVRLFETTQALAPALSILGFVFFADDPFRRLLGKRFGRMAWALPAFTTLAALLPLGLAALAAYVGVNFEAN